MAQFIEIKEAVENRLGSDYKVELHEVAKNNGVILHGLTIREGDAVISPTIYIDQYADTDAFEAAKNVVDTYLEHCNTPFDGKDIVSLMSNKNEILSRVIYRLVNTERNAEMLAGVPHRDFLDLSVLYIVPVTDGATVKITNQIMEQDGITLDELEAAAKVNTVSTGFHRQSMADIIAEMTGMESPDDGGMSVYTNREKCYGASVIIYGEMFKEFAEQMESDLYILPSSVHEIIAIPATHGMPVDELRMMVGQVNETEVSREDYLSGSVYRYSRATGQVEIAA